MVTLFTDVDVPPPPNQPDLQQLLCDHGAELDAAFIIAPHTYRFAQTQACVETGLDVLLLGGRLRS